MLTQHVLQRSVMICCQLSAAFCPRNRWKWPCGVLPGTASVWTFSLSAGCGYAATWSNTTQSHSTRGSRRKICDGHDWGRHICQHGKHLTVSLYSCSCLCTSHITTSLFRAVLPGMEALYVVWWDLGGSQQWAHRCGKLFRDLPCNIGARAEYTAAMHGHLHGGLGQYLADQTDLTCSSSTPMYILR